MLRKEDFPKEPIEILKDVLPSEEFKKLASLNQERLRCMAEADGLMGEVIEIESKLLVQLNKIRSIEAEIMLKSTSPKMQEADRACAYELGLTRQDFFLYAKNIRNNAILLISWLKHSNSILEPAGSCYENESG